MYKFILVIVALCVLCSGVIAEPNQVDPNQVTIRLLNCDPNKVVVKVLSVVKDRITIQIINIDSNSIVVKVDEKQKKSEIKKIAKRIRPQISETRASYKFLNEDQTYRHRYEVKEAVHGNRITLLNDSTEHRSDRIYGDVWRYRRVPPPPNNSINFNTHYFGFREEKKHESVKTNSNNHKFGLRGRSK